MCKCPVLVFVEVIEVLLVVDVLKVTVMVHLAEVVSVVWGAWPQVGVEWLAIWLVSELHSAGG